MSVALLVCLSATAAAPDRSMAGALPGSRLAVKLGGAWHVFWVSSRPERANRLLADAAQWRRVRDGVEYTELDLAGSGEAWRTKLVVARLDPRFLRLSLVLDIQDGKAAWTIDKLYPDAVFAVNAGQFAYAVPWGWVVIEGREHFAPGSGPLASALVFDSTGGVHWMHGAVSQRRVPHVAWAFQSYPTLLHEGKLPRELLGGSRSLDVAHRDARAAIGEDAQGRIIVALTRFNAFGEPLGFVPFGLTTPEIGAVLASLGAWNAVALDGGVSAQLALRGSSTLVWRGVRSVPLALVARSR